MLTTRRTERAAGAVAAVLGGTFVVAALAFATDGFETSIMDLAPSVVLGVLAGIALLFAAGGLFAHRRWGWSVDIAAHVVGMIAAVVALVGLSAGSDDILTSGEIVSGALLVLLVVSFFALWRTRPRRPLRRASHRIAAKLY
jgi:hypothetical protein